MEKQPRSYRGQEVFFAGTSAVSRRLASAGMKALKIVIYRGRSQSWEADTDKGKRWVAKTHGAWVISKTAPGTSKQINS